MNKKLGCLSPLAILSGFLAAFALLAVEVINGSAMFSPGPLHAAHADIGDDCGQCHAPFWSFQRMTERCLACHTEIQAELADSSTLHGTLVKGAASTCQTCHTEHAGPNAALTVMDTSTFPHEVTGFALTAHQARSPGIPFTCQDCHTPSLARFEQQTCLECHKQMDVTFMTVHLLQFGQDCLACHDGHDRFSRFDHAQTGFALTGRHAAADCSACHLGARSLKDLQIASSTCESCHLKDDAHQGRFGAACETCHNPSSWENATFDHNLAAFKLEGKHVNVECKSCHTQGYAGTPKDCFSCHQKDDAHEGQYGAACETCHNPSSWENATFDHNLAAFKLEGKHVNVECKSCHTQGYAGTPKDCFSCHQKDDAHQGRFGTACQTCHNPSSWENATFDHNLAAFKLEGKHVNVECKSCHTQGYAGTPKDCFSCHQKDDAHQGRFGTACQICHNPSSWENATFDHNLAAFKLEGKHVNVECKRCHTQGYAGTPKDCFSCHQKDDTHQGRFGAACQTCHNPSSWKNATFNHNLSRFPLDGAHVRVSCVQCHKNNTYQGTPTACAACHAEPLYHLGMFRGQACSQCHNTTAWRPAPYNGPHTFPMTHGSRHNTCSTCHQPTLAQWTCYTCHGQTEVTRKHIEEGIANFSDCMRCHPTGQEHEGGGDGGDNDGDD